MCWIDEMQDLGLVGPFKSFEILELECLVIALFLKELDFTTHVQHENALGFSKISKMPQLIMLRVNLALVSYTGGCFLNYYADLVVMLVKNHYLRANCGSLYI